MKKQVAFTTKHNEEPSSNIKCGDCISYEQNPPYTKVQKNCKIVGNIS